MSLFRKLWLWLASAHISTSAQCISLYILCVCVFVCVKRTSCLCLTVRCHPMCQVAEKETPKEVRSGPGRSGKSQTACFRQHISTLTTPLSTVCQPQSAPKASSFLLGDKSQREVLVSQQLCKTVWQNRSKDVRQQRMCQSVMWYYNLLKINHFPRVWFDFLVIKNIK